MDQVCIDCLEVTCIIGCGAPERIKAQVVAAMAVRPDIATQPQLAKKAGIAQSHISRIFAGQNISISTLEKLAAAIGKQPYELILGDADKDEIMSRIFGPQPPLPMDPSKASAADPFKNAKIKRGGKK